MEFRDIGQSAHVAQHHLHRIYEFSLQLVQSRLATLCPTADHDHVEAGSSHAAAQLEADTRIASTNDAHAFGHGHPTDGLFLK